MGSLDPFFPYYGSAYMKSRRYPVPRYSKGKEPLCGGAGFSTFHGLKQVDLMDIDPIIVGVWHYLMHARADEILALPEMPEVGDHVDNYSLPQEAKWLIGFWLNRGSAQPKKSRTAYSARTDRAQLNWGVRAKERIARQLPALEGWTIAEGSYETMANEEATWFIDPPYVDKGRYYRHSLELTEFGNVADFCRSRAGQVIVCEQAGADWLPFRALGSFKSTKGRTSEVFWTNDQLEHGLFEVAA